MVATSSLPEKKKKEDRKCWLCPLFFGGVTRESNCLGSWIHLCVLLWLLVRPPPGVSALLAALVCRCRSHVLSMLSVMAFSHFQV